MKHTEIFTCAFFTELYTHPNQSLRQYTFLTESYDYHLLYSANSYIKRIFLYGAKLRKSHEVILRRCIPVEFQITRYTVDSVEHNSSFIQY